MSIDHCRDIIAKAAGRPLSLQEVADIADQVERRIAARVTAGDSRFAAAAHAGRQLAGEELLAAILEKRNAAINTRIRQSLDAQAAARPGKEHEVVRAVLTGVNRSFDGAARSIDATAHAMRDRMLGGLIHDLRRDGLLEAVLRRDKAFDHDVAVELWAVRDPSSARSTNNTLAIAVARLLDRYQEALRGQLNDAGAWIGRLDNYIVRQSHDMFKIRDSGFADWSQVIGPRLDQRTFDGVTDRTAFLRQVWSNLSSGVHDTSTDQALAGMAGPGNLAKRLSQDRVLHFRSPDAWWEYNAQFGKGAVIDAVFSAIEKGTRDVALLRGLGPNPEAMFTAWVDRLTKQARDRGDFRMVDRLKSDWNERIFDVLTGAADMPGNPTLARVGSNIRTLQALTKLGGVVLSSIPDLAVNAAMLRHNGIGIFEAYAQQMRGLMPTGREGREIAESLGVGIDHLLGNVAHRFQAEDGMTGRMASAARLFYRLNGLTYWTDALKSSAGLMLSHNLARHAQVPFDQLPSRMQVTLRRYDISPGEWSQLAAERQIAADGENYILPARMQDTALAEKLQTYITDQVREGMTEPTAGNRAVATLGLQRGTPGGEAVRLLMQFKQFAITYIDRSLGREFRRNGVDAGGIAHLIVATTALGYLAMTLKDLAKGRNPRSPETGEDYAKLVMAAMVQGGGLGIYGDFLFGERNRMGQGAVATLAGPTAGTLDDVSRLMMSIRDQAGHPTADAIQFVKGHTPFLNLFYTRAALDYLVMYRIQEWANPGYLRRYERRVQKDNAQTFWLSPSEAAR